MASRAHRRGAPAGRRRRGWPPLCGQRLDGRRLRCAAALSRSRTIGEPFHAHAQTDRDGTGGDRAGRGGRRLWHLQGQERHPAAAARAELLHLLPEARPRPDGQGCDLRVRPVHAGILAHPRLPQSRAQANAIYPVALPRPILRGSRGVAARYGEVLRVQAVHADASGRLDGQRHGCRRCFLHREISSRRGGLGAAEPDPAHGSRVFQLRRPQRRHADPGAEADHQGAGVLLRQEQGLCGRPRAP